MERSNALAEAIDDCEHLANLDLERVNIALMGACKVRWVGSLDNLYMATNPSSERSRGTSERTCLATNVRLLPAAATTPDPASAARRAILTCRTDPRLSAVGRRRIVGSPFKQTLQK